MELLCGLKPHESWKPTKKEFYDSLAVHAPFKYFQNEKRVKEIDKEWKRFSKHINKLNKEGAE